MSRMLRVVLPFLLVVLAASVSGMLVAAGNQQATVWWRNPEIISKVGLKPEQLQRIEAIWKETSEEFRGEMEELERRETKLISMIDQGAEEAMVIRQIPRVESARANLSATRAVIAYRMRQVLTAPQRKLMESLAPAPPPLVPTTRQGSGTPGPRPPSTSGGSTSGSTPSSSPSRGSSPGRPAAPPR